MRRKGTPPASEEGRPFSPALQKDSILYHPGVVGPSRPVSSVSARYDGPRRSTISSTRPLPCKDRSTNRPALGGSANGHYHKKLGRVWKPRVVSRCGRPHWAIETFGAAWQLTARTFARLRITDSFPSKYWPQLCGGRLAQSPQSSAHLGQIDTV